MIQNCSSSSGSNSCCCRATIRFRDDSVDTYELNKFKQSDATIRNNGRGEGKAGAVGEKERAQLSRLLRFVAEESIKLKRKKEEKVAIDKQVIDRVYNQLTV